MPREEIDYLRVVPNTNNLTVDVKLRAMEDNILAETVPQNLISKMTEKTDAISDNTLMYVQDNGQGKYLKANKIADISKPTIGTINISTTWEGSISPYTQVVTVTGATITNKSKVDIQADSSLINTMLDADCEAMYIENTNGILTLVAVGNHPTTAISNVQVTITEVA